MTAPTDPQIAAVVERLSPAHKGAIRRAEQEGKLGLMFVRFYHASHRTRRSLISRGIGFNVWSGVALTPLGLAVRAHLERQDDER